MGSKVVKDYWGGTPLHDAAENGELEVGHFFHFYPCICLKQLQINFAVSQSTAFLPSVLQNPVGQSGKASRQRRGWADTSGPGRVQRPP